MAALLWAQPNYFLDSKLALPTSQQRIEAQRPAAGED
jgi:hypothetical protein